MKPYIMALDQGTTSSRCIIFDKSGNIISQASKEFPQYFPKNGWVEHEPEEIWESVLWSIKECMTRASISPTEIDSVGITNQRETTIVWDRITGEPVYRAIVWQCRRTADYIEELKSSGYGSMVTEKTGLILDPYFSGTKIKWILDNVSGTRERAEAGQLMFGTVDTWLLYKLTGGRVHATDYTNASRTMIFNIHTLEWDDELLRLLDIPKTVLPKVYPSGYSFGVMDKDILGEELLIAGIAGDQQAALFGECCFKPGEVKNTYGTGCFLLMNTGKQPVTSANGLVSTIAAGLSKEPDYALEGSVFVAGAAIKWLRDDLEIIKTAEETEDLALSVEDTNGVYIVPAFTGLGAPYWDAYARGAVYGLTRGTKKAHFVRAVLESLAYQSLDVLEAMEKDSGLSIESVKVDGGASNNNFLMQFQADLLGKSVVKPFMAESTALGAAFLSGLVTGYYKDLDEIRSSRVHQKTFVPSMDDSCRTLKIQGWHEVVKKTLS